MNEYPIEKTQKEIKKLPLFDKVKKLDQVDKFQKEKPIEKDKKEISQNIIDSIDAAVKKTEKKRKLNDKKEGI